MSSSRRAVLTILALAAAAVPAQAQSVWLPSSHGPSISIEGFKPILTEGNRNWTTATTAYFLSGRMPISGSVIATAELPFAYAGFKRSALGGTGVETSSTLGNPYVGIKLASAASPITADLGVRLPVRKSKESEGMAASVGFLADVDRMEAFAADLLSVGGHLGIRHRDPSGLHLHARGGPIMWFNTAKDRPGDDTELFLDYVAQAGYDVGRYAIIGGLSGRTQMTADEGSWSDRSIHHLGVSGSVAFGSVRPGIQVRVPLDDDLDDVLRYVIGLGVTVQLR